MGHGHVPAIDSQVRAWGNPANIGFVSFYEEFDDNNPHHPDGVQ